MKLNKEPITIIHPYYAQPDTIPLQMDIFKTFPEIRIVFVDDGSKEPLEVEGADVYRIEEDIPWNQSGARNLGFHVSDGWCLYSDIDHIVTKDVINSIRNRDWNKNCIYYLGRTENEKEIDTAYNCYFIHKEAFDKIGGYDEDFAGGYGFEDTLFFQLSKKFLEPVMWNDIKLECRADIGSTNLERDIDRNGRILDKKLEDLKPVNTPKLRFTWTKK